MKNVVGAGVLSLPLAFYQGGFWPATSVMLVFGAINCFTFWLVGALSQGKCDSYGEVWRLTVGKKTQWIPDCALICNGFLTLGSYMVS